MEIIVSLSHVPEVSERPVSDQEARALDAQDKQRIIETYGIDATEEEIKEGEEKRKKDEEEEKEEKAIKQPKDLGKFKEKEDQTGSDIQSEHDALNKI